MKRNARQARRPVYGVRAAAASVILLDQVLRSPPRMRRRIPGAPKECVPGRDRFGTSTHMVYVALHIPQLG